ncbi:MAG: di-trans,poly-cis-decaprenylcistransferase [Candidatus Pacebacteria bacterium]|nr:di-trans,poly-cis-decaprenylcistransferase [Candidatus Paceibacterota bacterium]
MSHAPHCLGFIMDGNRRWAKEQNLPTFDGHQKGLDVFLDIIKYVQEAGIAHAVFYAFSTENWKRSEGEVAYLMELFKNLLHKIFKELEGKNVRVRIVGRRGDFDSELQTLMTDLEEKTKVHEGTTIWIALSYGGRAEIVEAVNVAVGKGVLVTEESFARLLWTADMPEPDMIIRTSGEQRLSNFLTWKSAYSELYFIEKHWPALTKADFEDILLQYAKRERRLGT